MSNKMPNIFLSLVLLLTCQLLQGCTRQLWRPFFQSRVINPEIVHANPYHSAPHLLLCYRTDGGLPPVAYYYGIYLDAAFDSEYGYKGNQKTIQGILDELSTSEKLRKDKYVFPKQMHRQGGKLRRLSGAVDDVFHSHAYAIPNSNYVLIAYCNKFENIRQMREIPGYFENIEFDREFNPRLRFLIVPKNQPRFLSEHVKNNIFIIIGTPINLCYDAIILPLAAISIGIEGIGNISELFQND